MNRLRLFCLLPLAALLTLATACKAVSPEPAATATLTQPAATVQTQPTAPTETTVPETTAPTETTVPETTAPQAQSLTLTFAGDCTLGSNPNNYFADCGFIKTVGDDYGYPFRNVLPYFTQDELTLVNLEGTFCDQGNPRQKRHVFRGPTDYVRILTENSVELVNLANNHSMDYGQAGYDSTLDTGNPRQKRHVFRGPTDYVRILTENSVELVNLANNHSMDYGQAGYDSTLDTLDKAGIPYIQQEQSLLITTSSGLVVGLYGAVYYHLDQEEMVRQVRQLRQDGAQLVIVAPHWGVENTYTPTTEQQSFGHAAIEAGADIVFGTHPHVLQPIEQYQDGVIFYSLGNFSFGGNTAPKDFDTCSAPIPMCFSPLSSTRTV